MILKPKNLSKVLFPKTLFNRQIRVKQNTKYTLPLQKELLFMSILKKTNQLVKRKTLLNRY